jgi:hypothetical protein
LSDHGLDLGLEFLLGSGEVGEWRAIDCPLHPRFSHTCFLACSL